MPKAKTPRGRGGSSGARIRGGRSTPMLSSTRISYDDENEKEETSSGTHTNKTTRTNEVFLIPSSIVISNIILYAAYVK